MSIKMRIATALCTLALFAIGAQAIRCYQCSTDTDPDGEDNCGTYNKFDKERNIPVECNSGESNMPGTFCVKMVQQSPRGFIWDGRWRQVIRRCASITGVSGICNWGVFENGVFWQECFCSEDGCNGASSLALTSSTIIIAISALFIMFFVR